MTKKKKRAPNGFREFMKQKVPPIAIDAYPSHGSHSDPKLSKIKIAEATFHGSKAWYKFHDNDHLGSSEEEVHNKLDMHPDDFRKTPGADHIRNYTENSRDFNMRLIDAHHGREVKYVNEFDEEDSPKGKWTDEERHHANEAAKARHDNQVEGLDAAIAHKPLEHDVHVYHGTQGFNPGKLAAMHPERKIMLPAYMSTSIDKEQADRFAGGTSEFKRQYGGHIIHIHLKKGQKARYLGSNSEYEDEKEMLLPRNTVMKIHPKADVIKTHPGHRPTWVWHATIHDD